MIYTLWHILDRIVFYIRRTARNTHASSGIALAVACAVFTTDTKALALSDCNGNFWSHYTHKNSTKIGNRGFVRHTYIGDGGRGQFAGVVVTNCASGLAVRARLRLYTKGRSFEDTMEILQAIEKQLSEQAEIVRVQQVIDVFEPYNVSIVVNEEPRSVSRYVDGQWKTFPYVPTENCVCAAAYPELRGDRAPYSGAGE